MSQESEFRKLIDLSDKQDKPIKQISKNLLSEFPELADINDDLVYDFEGKPRSAAQVDYIIRLKQSVIEKTYTNDQSKYTNEELIDQMILIIDWLNLNPLAATLYSYYTKPNNKIICTLLTLQRAAKKNPGICECYNYMKNIIESRLVEGALYGNTKEGFTKFLLINHYGYKERVEQDITVTAKEVRFEFGNDIIDIDSTDITNEMTNETDINV